MRGGGEEPGEPASLGGWIGGQVNTSQGGDDGRDKLTGIM